MKPNVRRTERGQAITEYAVIAGLGLALLFVPFWPDPEGAGRISTFMYLIKAFDIYINSFHSVICLPVP